VVSLSWSRVSALGRDVFLGGKIKLDSTQLRASKEDHDKGRKRTISLFGPPLSTQAAHPPTLLNSQTFSQLTLPPSSGPSENRATREKFGKDGKRESGKSARTSSTEDGDLGEVGGRGREGPLGDGRSDGSDGGEHDDERRKGTKVMDGRRNPADLVSLELLSRGEGFLPSRKMDVEREKKEGVVSEIIIIRDRPKRTKKLKRGGE
jgi:hypothetical protein